MNSILDSMGGINVVRLLKCFACALCSCRQGLWMMRSLLQKRLSGNSRRKQVGMNDTVFSVVVDLQFAKVESW